MKRKTAILAVTLLCLTVGALACISLLRGHDPLSYTLTTGEKTGTYFPMGNLIASAVEKHDDKVKIKVVESTGSLENMKRLSTGAADLAIVQNDTPVSSSIRTLIPLHRGIMHFVTREDSGITSLTDLRGRKVGVGKPTSGSRHVVQCLLDHFGIGNDDYQPSERKIGESSQDLLEGNIDAMLFMAAVDSQAARDLVASGKVTYVSMASTVLDGGEVDGFAVTYPYVEKFVIPIFMHETHIKGEGEPKEPCVTFALRSSLVSTEDIPDEIASLIVRSILSERVLMMRKDQAAAEISENFGGRDVQFPLHHGAAAFYARKNPGFLERYAESMAFVLSAFIALYGLGVGASKWVTRSKKNRVDVYYSRLDAILTELSAEDSDSNRLAEIARELSKMRHEAVRELVDEKLTADESFRIFQSLLTDCQQQLAHRRSSTQGA